MKTIRHLTALVALVGLVLAFTGTAVQAKASDSTTASDTSTSSDTKFKGKITAIDTADKTVTVKSKEGDLTLTVTKKISKKLAVGDKVKGSYTTDSSGKMTAIAIKKADEKKKDAAGADSTSA